MPLTPIDESRGDRPHTPREEHGDRSLPRRLWGQAKELLANLPVGGSLFAPRDDADDETEATDDTVSDLPARDRPFTAPAGSHPDYNQAELVCIKTETELTISLPDNPEATITSDVWERVER